MEVSITALTDNRSFAKSLIRHSAALAPLRTAARKVGTSKLPFETLQLVFVDQHAGYVRAVGCNNDRLFQVNVGIPDPAVVNYQDSASFVRAVADRLTRAVSQCGLPPIVENRLIAAITERLRG